MHDVTNLALAEKRLTFFTTHTTDVLSLSARIFHLSSHFKFLSIEQPELLLEKLFIPQACIIIVTPLPQAW